MSRVLRMILPALALAAVLTGCDGRKEEGAGGEISVVATIFPVYDWARQVIGDAEGIRLTLLQDKGSDLHSYQPTAEDIVAITTCDLLVHVGGHSDSWLETVLAQAEQEGPVVVSLLQVLGDRVQEEELVEGMEHHEASHPAHHDGHSPDGHHQHTHHTLDEHIWLSLRHAQACVDHIMRQLCLVDGRNQEPYTENGARYIARLQELDEDYRATVAAAPVKTLLFADRFPFRYLVDDYGLSYYAAFSGCSAESEASFQTIAFLSEKAQQHRLDVLLTTERPGHRLAQAVIEATGEGGREILSMDSMQSVTLEDLDNGATYLSIMQKNLAVLERAMQGGSE